MASKFDKMVGKLSHEKHPPKNPKAVAAKIGMDKYGKAGMARKAAAGRARARGG